MMFYLLLLPSKILFQTIQMIDHSMFKLLSFLDFIFYLSTVQTLFKRKFFLSVWKICSVTPVLKSGDPSNVQNYRFISIIPSGGPRPFGARGGLIFDAPRTVGLKCMEKQLKREIVSFKPFKAF